MSEVPAVQRCSHGLLVVFFSFTTWFPEAPVDEQCQISVSARMIRTQTTARYLKWHYPKSGNRFLDFPAGEDSLGSSEIIQTSSVIPQEPQWYSMWKTLPYRPLTSLPLPLDSLFFAFRMNPELDCGDMASFGDARGLPLLSILSPSEADGLQGSSALPRNPSLVSPGSSFCPFSGKQTGTGRDRLSWMDLLLLLGDSCSSSSSASWRNKTNNLQRQC